ncbi:hypothetical protein PLICRDRAFT_439993 [Plicaturopsis crispa FD-325 SS-3]|uniref:J domain-containing protein n=1 Tax=Plicaturopsis crispa FD-325 SS-3 TaxID=944288 RepID=A0A0C9T6Q7_PLICR|nr:hypothetical protein PLICRDRAFT_439993 [Plicaturopsis crispa FD-325 SS-3]
MSLASARMLRRISPCRPNAICLFPPAWLWLHIPRCALGGMQRQYSTERPDPVLKPGTLYQMLGVTRVASQEDVKSRWYDLARQYHPDVNPGGRITFERAKRAYETLGDRAKRRMITSWTRPLLPRRRRQNRRLQNRRPLLLTPRPSLTNKPHHLHLRPLIRNHPGGQPHLLHIHRRPVHALRGPDGPSMPR